MTRLFLVDPDHLTLGENDPEMAIEGGDLLDVHASDHCNRDGIGQTQLLLMVLSHKSQASFPVLTLWVNKSSDLSVKKFLSKGRCVVRTQLPAEKSNRFGQDQRSGDQLIGAMLF